MLMSNFSFNLSRYLYFRFNIRQHHFCLKQWGPSMFLLVQMVFLRLFLNHLKFVIISDPHLTFWNSIYPFLFQQQVKVMSQTFEFTSFEQNMSMPFWIFRLNLLLSKCTRQICYFSFFEVSAILIPKNFSIWSYF